MCFLKPILFLLVITRSDRQKISRDTVELNSTINQLNLIYVFRILHPATVEYTFFLRITWNVHQSRPHLGYKTHPSNFERAEIKQMMFSDHTGIKLDIKNRKVTGKFPAIWKSNSMLLNNTWVKEYSQEKFLNILNSLKMKIKYQSLWNVAKVVLRGKWKNVLGKKDRSKLDNLSLYLGKLEKEKN